MKNRSQWSNADMDFSIEFCSSDNDHILNWDYLTMVDHLEVTNLTYFENCPLCFYLKFCDRCANKWREPLFKYQCNKKHKDEKTN